MLWLLGLVLSAAGLSIWLEFGCMIPRSGGEKVYLEAAYRRPKLLATTVFAFQIILLGFTGMCGLERFSSRAGLLITCSTGLHRICVECHRCGGTYSN